MDKENHLKGEVALYKNHLEVRLNQETVWLTQKQMAELFNTDRSVIGRHVQNIFKTKELDGKRNVQKMHVPFSDKPAAFYSLDVIISVGYRVNSKQGTQFRIWATQVLKKHLINGYTLNEKRLKAAENKYRELQDSLKLLGNVISLEGVSTETKGIIKVITEYSRALEILDDFDHQHLIVPKGTRRLKFKLTYDAAHDIITAMKQKFKDSELVGLEKDKSLLSSLGALYQCFDGKELYPTVEEKAAHLLYFVTKNHSFVNGNKRIAALLFIYFLEQNGLLFQPQGNRRIDDAALVALTLMIAASKPQERDVMIRIILNLLV